MHVDLRQQQTSTTAAAMKSKRSMKTSSERNGAPSASAVSAASSVYNLQLFPRAGGHGSDKVAALLDGGGDCHPSNEKATSSTTS